VSLAAQASCIGSVKRVFASDLNRAVDTAREIVAAQRRGDIGVAAATTDGEGHANGGHEDGDAFSTSTTTTSLLAARTLEVVQLCELRERDFGGAEGKKFRAAGHGLADAGAESRESMRARAEKFAREHLVPVLMDPETGNGAVVVVAHGLILDVLLRMLLEKFAPAELTRLTGTSSTWQHVVWGNTGYVELVVRASRAASLDDMAGESTNETSPASASGSPDGEPVVSGNRMLQTYQSLLPARHSMSMSVVGINVMRHLEGLKKTRGGIGSAQFDKRQRTIDSFFGPAVKKPKTG